MAYSCDSSTTHDHRPVPRRSKSEPVPWQGKAAAVALTLLVDVVFLWVLHIGGTALAHLPGMVFGTAGHNGLHVAVQQHGLGAFRPDVLFSTLPVGSVTAVYLAVAVVTAALCFGGARRGGEPSAAAVIGTVLVSAPALLYPLCMVGWWIAGFASGVLGHLVTPFTDDSPAISSQGPAYHLAPAWWFLACAAYGMVCLLGLAVHGALGNAFSRLR